MATKQLTAEQQAEMDVLGLSTDEFEIANTRDELPAGTYRLTVASGKVSIKGGDNVMTDAIEASIRCIPNDSNGTPVPRLSTFMKLVLPMKHGRYTPNAISLQMGLSALRALAAAANTSVPTLVEAFKNQQMPVELIGAGFVGKVSYKEGKNGDGMKFVDVKIDTSKTPTLTPFKSTSSTGNDAAFAKPAARNSVADDAGVPF